MSTTGLEVFDRTLHATNVWLNDVNQELGWDDRQRSYAALRAVLHALRDRLSVELTAKFSAQLPILLRGVFFEGWHPAKTPVSEKSKDDFLWHVSENLPPHLLIDPSVIVSAVLTVISDHVSPGEVDKLKATLPKGFSDLWP